MIRFLAGRGLCCLLVRLAPAMIAEKRGPVDDDEDLAAVGGVGPEILCPVRERAAGADAE